MRRFFYLLTILIFFCFSCEKQDILIDSGYLDIYCDLDITSDGIYLFEYPMGNESEYITIKTSSEPYQRIFWYSEDMFATILWGDTLWTPIVGNSIYSNGEGDSQQLAYIHPSHIGDTISITAIIYNDINLEKEIKIKIKNYDEIQF